MSPATPVFEVVAAVIEAEGRYLITRREHGHLEGFWEFPGGKVQPAENLPESLRREFQEELGAEIAVEEKLETATWHYGDRTVVLHFFRCRLASGQLTPQEGQAVAWVRPEDLCQYRFPPADAALIARLSCSERA